MMTDDITFDELKDVVLEVMGMKPRAKRLPLTPEQRQIEAECDHQAAQERAQAMRDIMAAAYGEDELRDMELRRQSDQASMKRALSGKVARLRNGQRKRRR